MQTDCFSYLTKISIRLHYFLIQSDIRPAYYITFKVGPLLLAGLLPLIYLSLSYIKSLTLSDLQIVVRYVRYLLFNILFFSCNNNVF